MSKVTEANDLGSVFSLLAEARGAIRIRSRGEQVGMRLSHDAVGPVGIDQIAETAPSRVPAPVRFTGYEAVSAQAADMWKSACAYVRDAVLACPGAAGQPLVAANAARLLAATTLAAFPNNALADPTTQDRHDGSPAILRRAVAFIDEHAHEDITAADIAYLWGFHSSSRLAAAYRQAYGICPGHTLRNRAALRSGPVQGPR